jgi:transposase
VCRIEIGGITVPPIGRFSPRINAKGTEVPNSKIIRAILDNYGTHEHPKVRAWLARHPRWVCHFTPTSASWLNAVEGFFSVLTRRRIRAAQTSF